MTSQLRKVWSRTVDGWLYAYVGVAFVLGARPSSASPGYTGGTHYPSGGWLVWGPGETHATTVVAPEEIDAWVRAHSVRRRSPSTGHQA